MTTTRHTVFLFNLLQDVNILRPLVYLAAREFDDRILFLVSSRFLDRDRERSWQREIAEIGADVGAAIHIYETPLDAFAVLQGKGGMLIAGSESSLSAHAETHYVFRIAPASFLKVTLQHGYECVGFMHSRQHDIANGRHVTFAADILCSWCPPSALKSLVPSERPKLYVTGPSTILQTTARPVPTAQASGGLVCENLHSVRLRASGNFGVSFLEIFRQFCEHQRHDRRSVNLRPHPGGQFVLRHKISLPDNVIINNLPIYKVDLSAFDYGISAPSTVLIDLLLADLPVAVWRDEGGVIDIGNYQGLTEISGLDDWLAFTQRAVEEPQTIVQSQREFLNRLALLTNKIEVYRRFARLLSGAIERIDVDQVARPATAVEPTQPQRILFIANATTPTLEIWFSGPLASMISDGRLIIDLLTEVEFAAEFKTGVKGEAAREKIRQRIKVFDPDLIVCCRYSGPHSDAIVEVAGECDVTLLYHIDDDLLNVPREIGERKFAAHNRPERREAVDLLLREADLIYCSTKPLRRRLRRLGYRQPMVVKPICGAGEILVPASRKPVLKVGYMGFDHAHDLALVLPALVQYLRRYPAVRFELFGSIPMPKELAEFGDRITTLEPVRVYAKFLRRFSALGWDIGICPLAPLPFNTLKANTKWVEYSSIGAAVIASRGIVYDGCCADGCGILAGGPEEWFLALDHLTRNPEARFEMVRRAQERVVHSYSVDVLRRQVLEVFDLADALAAQRKEGVRAEASRGNLARQAVARPDAAKEPQRRFIKQLELVTDETQVYRRFAQLLGSAAEGTGVSIRAAQAREWSRAFNGAFSRSALPLESRVEHGRDRAQRVLSPPFIAPENLGQAKRDAVLAAGGRARPFTAEAAADRSRSLRVSPVVDSERILLLTDAIGATQAINFARPLAAAVARGTVVLKMVEDRQVRDDPVRQAAALFAAFSPTLLILSRYTGAGHSAFIACARQARIPIIYHIDDDLLSVPITVGEAKFAHYNSPARLANLRAAIAACDLIYASTPPLGARMRDYGLGPEVVSGAIGCAVDPVRFHAPAPSSRKIIGYAATAGHGRDLDLALGGLVQVLDADPSVSFELFGSLPMPDALAQFGSRVLKREPIGDYDDFLATLAELGWWFGIAPLENNPFNGCKTETKWLEYSFAGIPTVASDVEVYRRCCRDGAGILVPRDASWEAIMVQILRDGNLRNGLAYQAQQVATANYSLARLQSQLTDVFQRAAEIARNRQASQAAYAG